MKDDLVYVAHMLEAACKASRLVAHETRESFESNEVLTLAVTHLLQNIGESARRITPQFASGHPDIPWKAIVGMRHKVVVYIDLDIVWDVVTRDLPGLIARLQAVLTTDQDQES